MFTRSWITDFVLSFAVTLVVAIIVTLLWNVIAHGNPAVDWATCFRLAIILGIALPVASRASSRGQKQ